MESKPSVSFDSEGKVRVLEPEKFKQTEELQTQCREFVSSMYILFRILTPSGTLLCYVSPGLTTEISEFNEGVSTVLEVLNAQAEQIERAKLKVRHESSLRCHSNQWYIDGFDLEYCRRWVRGIW
jgi:hypothetical protein